MTDYLKNDNMVQETIISGSSKDVNMLLKALMQDNIIMTSTVVTSLKSYWNDDGTEVIKSDELSITVLITYKSK